MKKYSKKNAKHMIVIASIYIIIILIAYVRQKIKSDSITYGYQLCTGKVTGGRYISIPAAYNLIYQYEVDNIPYYNVNSHISIHRNYYKYFMGKEFPVIYSTKHPRRSQLLIFPRHFKTYNLDFPDSLDWVKQYEDVY